MDKKVYARGLVGQYWYNFTEAIAMVATYRPIPKNVTYTKMTYGNKKLNFINTFCRNDLTNKKKPLFLYIHGGGWISGITDMRNPYVCNWANLGFYCASVSYSYAPQEIFPTQIREIFTAIDYIIDHAKGLNIDTENVVIAGESAGGYYISFVAHCLAHPDVLKKLGITFRNADKFKIKVLVSHCGGFYPQNLVDENKEQSQFPDIRMMASTFFGRPLEESRKYLNSDEGKLAIPEIDGDFPPSFLIWATKDYLRYETFELSERLTALGVEHKTYKADGTIASHAWSIATVFKEAQECLKETIDFTLPHLPDYFTKKNENWILK